MTRPTYTKRRLGDVDGAYDAFLALGFATADFEGQPEPETLQCRNELDRTNWIGLLLKCQAMIAYEMGGEPCDPPIRCTSNRMYAPTYFDVEARMYVLLNQAGAAQANWWRLKDVVRAARSNAELAAVDLTEGWPDA